MFSEYISSMFPGEILPECELCLGATLLLPLRWLSEEITGSVHE